MHTLVALCSLLPLLYSANADVVERFEVCVFISVSSKPLRNIKSAVFHWREFVVFLPRMSQNAWSISTKRRCQSGGLLPRVLPVSVSALLTGGVVRIQSFTAFSSWTDKFQNTCAPGTTLPRSMTPTIASLCTLPIISSLAMEVAGRKGGLLSLRLVPLLCISGPNHWVVWQQRHWVCCFMFLNLRGVYVTYSW